MVKINKNKIATQAFRYGTISFYTNDDPVGSSLNLYGEWGYEEIRLLSYLIGKGSYIADIGAYIGTHSIAFSRIAGNTGKIFSFEPLPTSYNLLKENIKQNNLKNVKKFNYGLGDKNETIKVGDVDIHPEHNNFGSFSLQSESEKKTISIKIRTLDSEKLSKLDLIKCDVEGFETQVLNGAKKTILEYKPFIYSEVNSIDGGIEQLKVLKTFGYKTFLHRAKVFNIENYNSNLFNKFGLARETNLLSIHKSDFNNYSFLCKEFDIIELSSVEIFKKEFALTKRFGDSWTKDKDSQLLVDYSDLVKQTNLIQEENIKLKKEIEDSMYINKKNSNDIKKIYSAVSVLNENLSRFADKTNIEHFKNELAFEINMIKKEFEKKEVKLYKPMINILNKIKKRVNYELDLKTKENNLVHKLRSKYWKFKGNFSQCNEFFDNIKKIKQSGLFDEKYYISQNNDVKTQNIPPVYHYLRAGYRESRQFHPNFDSQKYKITNKLTDNEPALIHFINNFAQKFSIKEYFEQFEETDSSPTLLDEKSITQAHRRTYEIVKDSEWDTLHKVKYPPEDNEPIDIIIPVYKNLEEVKRCIFSVLDSRRKNKTKFELLIVNDCSPEPELSKFLKENSDAGYFSLLINEENRGFVQTVNRGFNEHKSRNTLILNSDTEVFSNWLDRIIDIANKDSTIGTITPLSNAATICSYPHFNYDYDYSYEISDNEIDNLFSELKEEEIINIPSGVGFCMYIRRALLDEVGNFDAELFGLGYGEENEFCMRAYHNGWKNVLCPNVFVRHYGSTSFGEEGKIKRVVESVAKVNARFPNYDKLVHDFCKQEPIHSVRAKIDAKRVQKSLKEKFKILFITHSLGGGVQSHIDDLAEYMNTENEFHPIHLIIQENNKVSFDNLNIDSTPNLSNLSLDEDTDLILEILKILGIQHIHIHSFVGADYLKFSEFITSSKSFLNIKYDVTLHDYTYICPRIHLMDKNGEYCGEPDIKSCQKCIRKNSSPFGKPQMINWRSQNANLLSGARKIFSPSNDTANRYNKYLPDLKIEVRPHPEKLLEERLEKITLKPKEQSSIKVCCIGALGPHKGSNIILNLVKDASKRQLPINYAILGYTNIDKKFENYNNITISGKYNYKDLPQLIKEINPNYALFTSLWPETYSYTLSLAFYYSIYPVAFDLGAIAERIKTHYGSLIPFEKYKSYSYINDYIMDLHKNNFTKVKPVKLEDFNSNIYYDL